MAKYPITLINKVEIKLTINFKCFLPFLVFELFVELTKPIQVELQDSELTNNKNKINKKK